MCIRDRLVHDNQRQVEQLGILTGHAGAPHVRADDGAVGKPVSYTHLRAHETVLDLVCRLLLEKKKKTHDINP